MLILHSVNKKVFRCKDTMFFDMGGKKILFLQKNNFMDEKDKNFGLIDRLVSDSSFEKLDILIDKLFRIEMLVESIRSGLSTRHSMIKFIRDCGLQDNKELFLRFADEIFDESKVFTCK